jgi:tRNA (guanine26-N2/guanine27-N2)-dimethyltransferase
MRVTEGGIEFEVPDARDGASEGRGDGVFYNPTQELNRDVTVAVLRAYREREPRAETYLDAMTASGVRALRAAAEGWDVTAVDTDPDAVALARENAAHNGLTVNAVERDANVHMHDSTVDVIDIDPFGTPIPFADAAFANARDLVAVTATDTAPLCGAHFESGVRHYSAVPRNTEYHAEMGLRVLISALVRTAARYDLAAEPVFSHATKHYARTYLRLDSGAQAADALIEKLGHVDHCEHCLFREATSGLIADPHDWCPKCDEAIQTAGPIWLGRTCDPEFARAVRDAVDDGMGTAEEARDLCETVAAELAEPTHYDQHRLCKRWGVGAGAMDEFLDQLREAGHAASRTHYGGTTFKTDADVTEIREAALDGD